MMQISQQRRERRLALVKEHIACENRHDVEGILKTFGTALAYEDQAWRQYFPDTEGIRAYYEEMLGASADLRIEVEREHVGDESIVLEITLTGTHTGPWHGLPATRRRFSIPLCAVYSFDADDRLAGERVYYDRATVLAQVGMFREPDNWRGRLAMALNHPVTMTRAVLGMLRR
jgi:steroid delta-isomerase-like uncharacterized protein